MEKDGFCSEANGNFITTEDQIHALYDKLNCINQMTNETIASSKKAKNIALVSIAITTFLAIVSAVREFLYY